MTTNRTFVSYSRADGEFALRLASDLRARGANVWLDQLDIEAGTRWDSAIEDALRDSSHLLVLLSPKAVASQNVLDEVSFALEEGKTVVPVLVESCAIPMRLRRLQHVDFTRDYDGALTRLLGTLGVVRSAPPAAEARAPEPAPAPRNPEPEAPPAEPAARDTRFVPEPMAAEPLPSSFESSTAVTRRAQWIGLGAGALGLTVVIAVLWQGGSAGTSVDTTPPPETETQMSATAPPAAADPTVTPRDTPPTNSGSAAGAPAAPTGSNTGSAAIGRLFGNAPLAQSTDLERATGEAGLGALLGVTRSLATRDTLTTEDLERLAEADSVACRGQPANSPCSTKAMDAVQSTLKTVCSKNLGARPADEAGALRHDMQVGSCQQAYLNVLITRMNLKAGEAIRKIKAG